MKPLLKSPYTAVSVALASLVALMVLVGVYSSTVRIYSYSSAIASSIKWEVELVKAPTNELFKEATNSTLKNLVNTASGNVASAYKKLMKSGMIKDALVAQAINIGITNRSRRSIVNESSKLPNTSIAYQGIAFWVVEGVNKSNCFILPTFVSGGKNLTRILDLNCSVASERQLHRINALLMYGSSIELTTVSPRIASETTFMTGLAPSTPYVIVTNPSRAQEVMNELIQWIQRRFSSSLSSGNSSVEVRFSMTVALVDLKSATYLNPASMSATYKALIEISDKLRRSLGFNYASLPEAGRKLQVFSQIESFLRIGSMLSLIIPLIAVFVSVPSTAESGILSVRRSLGLIRLRGLRSKALKQWFIKSSILFGISGYIIGAGSIIILSYLGSYPQAAYDILRDPFIEGFTVTAIALALGYLAHKSINTSYKVTPAEAVKTRLTDEALLEPVKTGWWGWFSVISGLFFVAEGLAQWSAGMALPSMASRPSSIGLLIALIVLFMFEASLRPFAPVLLAYGFAKLIAAHIDRLMEGLSSVFKGAVALAAKSITSLIRRRSVAVAILLIFSVTLMTQSITSTAYMTSTINTATKASVGAEYLGIKDMYLSNLSLMHEVVSNYGKMLDGHGVMILTFPAFVLFNNSITRYINVIIIPNISNLLRNTYWCNGWGTESSFKNLIKELSTDHNVAIYSSSKGVNASSIRVLTSGAGMVKLCDVKTVGHVTGFPGLPVMGLSNKYYEGVVLAGPWIIELMRNSPINRVENIRVKIIVYTSSRSLADRLASNSFRITSLKSLESSPEYLLFKDLTISQTLPLITSLALMALSVAVAAVIAWSVSAESSRMYILLRIRGVSKLSALKVIITEWGVLTLISIGVGVLGGISLGITPTNNLATQGFSPGLLTSALLGGAVDLGLASPHTSIPLMQIGIASLIAWIIVTLIPAFISLRIYSGSVRGKFIEVR